MSDVCPLCGQQLPEKQGRLCALCGKPIRRHDRYRHIGGKTVHRDCKDPRFEFTEKGGKEPFVSANLPLEPWQV